MPARPPTDASRRAKAAYAAKLAAAGVRKVTLRLPGPAAAALDDLKAKYGSKDAAAAAAIIKLHEDERTEGES